jgi:acyl carrier protein
MTTDDEIRQGVREFVLTTYLIGEPAESLQDSTPLLTTGIMSSLATLELVAYVENAFAVVLQPEDLGVDRLDTVDAIVALVRERLPQEG